MKSERWVCQTRCTYNVFTVAHSFLKILKSANTNRVQRLNKNQKVFKRFMTIPTIAAESFRVSHKVFSTHSEQWCHFIVLIKSLQIGVKLLCYKSELQWFPKWSWRHTDAIFICLPVSCAGLFRFRRACICPFKINSSAIL